MSVTSTADFSNYHLSEQPLTTDNRKTRLSGFCRARELAAFGLPFLISKLQRPVGPTRSVRESRSAKGARSRLRQFICVARTTSWKALGSPNKLAGLYPWRALTKLFRRFTRQ